MAFSVKNDVFHQILVYFSKYISKLSHISTNSIIGINFKKLLINIKFVLLAIFSIKVQNQFFSPSVDYRATVDHYNVFKSCFCVLNLLIEFNVLSKSGLRTEIGQLLVEISLLCHHKTSEITLLGYIRKKLK
jgi:hypothetical protein